MKLAPLRGQGFQNGLTMLPRRKRPGVALVPVHQSTVKLFAGVADRAPNSEIRDETALPPINDGACRCLQVHRNLTLRHERARGIESRHVL